jgi:hypothetical protein
VGDENATGSSWVRERYGANKPELVGLFYELSFEQLVSATLTTLTPVLGTQAQQMVRLHGEPVDASTFLVLQG